jgi:hypothetical protein
MTARSRAARGSQRATTGRGADPGSFGEWLRFFDIAQSDPYWAEPYWPPDVYAITAAFLRRTGVYVKFVNSIGGHGRRPAGDGRAEPFGNEWRRSLSADLGEYLHGRSVTLSLPREVKRWWRRFATFNGSFADAARDLRMQEAAWNLCVAADVASRGIGVRTMKVDDNGNELDEVDPFLAFALTFLVDRNERLSFCLKIPTDKIAVLGKQHTPQRGCTIRSLTHHLSYYVPSEIKAYWAEPWNRDEKLEVLNLLLLPWPTQVHAHDFKVVRDAGGVFSRFEYQPRRTGTPAEMSARVALALKRARSHASSIHGIVFPELSLTPREFTAVERLAIRNRALLIAGVRGMRGETPTNACAIQPYGLTAAYTGRARASDYRRTRRMQFKHHQWCLDRDQILQYGLGARMTATRDHWERMHLDQREITFVNVAPWLTACALICEDLARQEPMAEIVRAVGPNVVFALLMDGPQLRHRWPSRYASVLAEDPGSSVLTLTNLGMASRSRTMDPDARDRSRTIGLWRDKRQGEHELTLDKDHDAGVLSLLCHTEKEYTLDGRSDQGAAHFPAFAGFRSFKAAP